MCGEEEWGILMGHGEKSERTNESTEWAREELDTEREREREKSSVKSLLEEEERR